MFKRIELGDNIHTCSCFFSDSQEHPTNVDTGSNCLYCGYYSLKQKVSVKFLKRHQKRKQAYEENAHRVFQRRMKALINGEDYWDINIDDHNGE